ncbi:MAG: N-acetyltransferase [Cyanobacteria bacterium HKST-UBA06]|nr:N-acetyltransferase [Cyanobacteria bacterium HKST-UBA04]MCA9806374.1 N-acetyltransferase [Cyanobacteria bacterium HKST-UBA06]MCA9842080.1 N-acetyltransferase [Cyanobacteria bacterium HKST-UBA03]
MASPPWHNHIEAFDSYDNLDDASLLIHASAYVDEPTEIGAGTQVMHFTHIRPHAVIGRHCIIGANVTIDSGVFIGNHVQVDNNVSLTGGAIVEDYVYFGPCALITPLKLMRGNAAHISSIQPSLVKQGARIGANTTIAAGFTVGRFAFVESGSVVDCHVPDFAVMQGNPIQLMGWRCECEAILPIKAIETVTECPRCGIPYVLADDCLLVKHVA